MPERKSAIDLAKLLAPATLRPGSIWNHIKSGEQYIVLSSCLLEEDLTPMVVYAPLNALDLGLAVSWARPFAEFTEKFEEAPIDGD